MSDDTAKLIDAEGNAFISSDPISNYLTTIPSKSTVVFQGRLNIYKIPGDEALYAATHSYLDRVENVLLMHWSNSTDAPQKYTELYTTQLKVTQGESLSVSVNLGLEFKGLSVGTGVEKKTFTEKETTSSETRSVEVSIPPNTDVWFYQRKYIFRTKMTWVLDAWNELWNAGSKGAYHIQEGTVISEIHTKDYVTTSAVLKGTQSLGFDSLHFQDQKAWTTRKFENLTSKSRSTLERMGINGSQQG